MNEARFPVTLEIDYPDRELNRLTTFFRSIMLIPPVVILALLTGPGGWGDGSWRFFFASGSILFAPALLMILFRRTYPRWWFDWNVNMTRFSARVGAYAALLTDEFPSTEREQSVHITIPYPDVKKDLLPGMPLVKWFLAIPHCVILLFLGIAAGFCVFISWFAILFTGRFPRSWVVVVVGGGRGGRGG
ncbi:MAG: DUF4389 domain-containing protein, partial [Spirochaetia bacterium]